MPGQTNVLFLMTDQHRTDTLGCYGNPHGVSPHLDNLASEATVFDAAFTPTAICTPARASLLTARHPFEHGLLANYEWNSGHRRELPEGTPTLADDLERRGYNHGYVGKWHIGEHRGPDWYGFDGFHVPGPINDHAHPEYRAWLEARGMERPTVRDQIFTTLPDGSRGHLLAGRLDASTDATFERFLADKTIEQLRDYAADAENGTPFFLACSFFGPHLPYLIPDEWYDRFDPEDVELPASMAETFDGKPAVQATYSAYWGSDGFDPSEWKRLIATYWGYVAMIDAEIGRIMAAVDELGLAESTAVFFTADHGEFTGAHRLNDKGPAMYDDVYRIPGILKVPGRPARRSQEFVSLVDFSSTILDIIGAEDQGHGRSVLPLTSPNGAPEDWPNQIVCEFHGHQFPYAQRMIRTHRHKLVVNPEGTDELYDLDADPSELHNVITAPHYSAVREEMTQRLYHELVHRGDRFALWMSRMHNIPVDQRIRP